MSESRSPEGGFTLLEAVVAVAIVGAASVSVLAAFGGELRAAERARTGLEAEALASDRLAVLRLQSTERLSALPDSVTRGHFAPPLDQYRWEMVVRPSFGTRDLYDAAVTVTWDVGKYTLRTRLYRPALRRAVP